jgi:hypothetical protein
MDESKITKEHSSTWSIGPESFPLTVDEYMARLKENSNFLGAFVDKSEAETFAAELEKKLNETH